MGHISFSDDCRWSRPKPGFRFNIRCGWPKTKTAVISFGVEKLPGLLISQKTTGYSWSRVPCLRLGYGTQLVVGIYIVLFGKEHEFTFNNGLTSLTRSEHCGVMTHKKWWRFNHYTRHRECKKGLSYKEKCFCDVDPERNERIEQHREYCKQMLDTV